MRYPPADSAARTRPPAQRQGQPWRHHPVLKRGAARRRGCPPRGEGPVPSARPSASACRSGLPKAPHGGGVSVPAHTAKSSRSGRYSIFPAGWARCAAACPAVLPAWADPAPAGASPAPCAVTVPAPGAPVPLRRERAAPRSGWLAPARSAASRRPARLSRLRGWRQGQ